MVTTRFIAGMFSAVLVLNMNLVYGQSYPNKTIRIVAAKSGTGFIASNIIKEGISGSLGQQVIVDVQGGGFTQQEIVAKAAPDGHTLIVSGGSIWLAPLTQKAPYDPVRDFAPISLLAVQPFILYVSLSLPVKSVKELIALAKGRPGELNNSIGGLGGSAHLSGELFKSMAGVNIVAVPYSSESLELSDLLSGRVQLTITSPASLMEQVKSGKLRALAVTTAQPSALFPDLPSIAATLPGYQVEQLTSIFAPARTPQAIIGRLNQEIVRLFNSVDTKERLYNAGAEAISSSPEQLASTMKSEMARWSKVIKDAGIKTD